MIAPITSDRQPFLLVTAGYQGSDPPAIQSRLVARGGHTDVLDGPTAF
jgi:hypothetical protein